MKKKASSTKKILFDPEIVGGFTEPTEEDFARISEFIKKNKALKSAKALKNNQKLKKKTAKLKVRASSLKLTKGVNPLYTPPRSSGVCIPAEFQEAAVHCCRSRLSSRI